MKKQILAWMLLLAVMLGACTGKAKTNEPQMNVNVGKMQDGSSYTERDGEEHRTFEVKSGETWEVGVSITRQDGTLNLRIADEEGKELYQGNALPSSSFTVRAEEEGTYTVVITAEHFIGDYGITLSNVTASKG